MYALRLDPGLHWPALVPAGTWVTAAKLGWLNTLGILIEIEHFVPAMRSGNQFSAEREGFEPGWSDLF